MTRDSRRRPVTAAGGGTPGRRRRGLRRRRRRIRRREGGGRRQFELVDAFDDGARLFEDLVAFRKHFALVNLAIERQRHRAEREAVPRRQFLLAGQLDALECRAVGAAGVPQVDLLAGVHAHPRVLARHQRRGNHQIAGLGAAMTVHLAQLVHARHRSVHEGEFEQGRFSPWDSSAARVSAPCGFAGPSLTRPTASSSTRTTSSDSPGTQAKPVALASLGKPNAPPSTRMASAGPSGEFHSGCFEFE